MLRLGRRVRDLFVPLRLDVHLVDALFRVEHLYVAHVEMRVIRLVTHHFVLLVAEIRVPARYVHAESFIDAVHKVARVLLDATLQHVSNDIFRFRWLRTFLANCSAWPTRLAALLLHRCFFLVGKLVVHADTVFIRVVELGLDTPPNGRPAATLSTS